MLEIPIRVVGSEKAALALLASIENASRSVELRLIVKAWKTGPEPARPFPKRSSFALLSPI